MKISKSFVTSLPIIILLIFPEYSIQTSLHLDKTSCHTIYICKSYLGLGVADWLIVAMASVLIFYTVVNSGRVLIRKDSIFYKVFLVCIIYLLIGIIYNLFVNFDLVAYLYDFKLFLYFVVTYYWILIFKKNEFTLEYLIFLFSLIAIGTLWDYIYVQNFGQVERPNNITFMPVILPLMAINFVILFLICFKKYRFWFFLLLVFEILSILNQISLSQIYGISLILIFIFLYKYQFTESSFIFTLIISHIILFVFLPLLLYEVVPIFIDYKSGGFDIRIKKTISAFNNYFINIPVIIGKGLGSTYFETFESEHSNIYSTGINHVDGNVKFIMHSPLSFFYKFGIIGALILLIIFYRISFKLQKLYFIKKDNLARFLSLSYPTFIIGTMLTPGILKNAILAAILILITDQKIYDSLKIKN